MSQTIQSPPSVSPANNATSNINHTQVAPQDIASNQQDYTDQEKQNPPINNTQSRFSNSMANRTTPHTKHGFLSLLFCCASDTSALADQGLTKPTPATHSTITSPEHFHESTGRSKRKKKHWYSRWVSTKQTVPHKHHQEQERPTTQLDHTDNDSNPLSPLPPTTTPSPLLLSKEDKNKNGSPPSTPTTAPPTEPSSDPDYSFGFNETGPIAWLLPPISSEHTGRKCLVLDLDETLVHSSFKIIPNPDFIVPVEIDQQVHSVYVLKRPGVDEFMRKMGEIYEIVVFTASLSKYADPVLDMLDKHQVVKHRLFRESCFNHKGSYVKDLSQLGRDLAATLILDNSPTSYLFHTSNAVPVSTWFNDPHDTELTDLVDFLNDLTFVDDVTLILDSAIEPTTK